MKKIEIKKETELLIDELPEDAGWDDLMYKILRQTKNRKRAKR